MDWSADQSGSAQSIVIHTRPTMNKLDRKLRATAAQLALGGAIFIAAALAGFPGHAQAPAKTEGAGQSAATPAAAAASSPIYGVTVPVGYRRWELVAPSHRPDFDEIRSILGNDLAMQAYRSGTLPFPDGTILAKLAWKHVPLPELGTAYAPGSATTLQIMVKDSKKYAATGGWGFGRFIDGKPADEAQHQTCFACHQALVKNHDFVFTRYAP